MIEDHGRGSQLNEDGDDLHVITREQLRELAADESAPAVSLYFPTNHAPVEPEENSLYLKNLLAVVQERLLDSDMRRTHVASLLDPLRQLLGDADFWLHQEESLALLRTPDRFAYYRLPYGVSERAIVAPAVYVKPLFQTLFPDGYFFVLALSQHAVRLLRCTRHGARVVDLEKLPIPRSLEEALRFDDLQKPELQHHPMTGPGRASVGRGPAEGRAGGRQHGFHGHGESGEEVKTQIRRYLHAVDAGLARLLGSETAPMIVAGVDYIRSIYRDVTHYKFVMDEGIDGNPDRTSDARLHAMAAPIIEEQLKRVREEAREKHESLRARGLASDDLQELLGAAHVGKVDTAFVRADIDVWGSYDVETDSMTRHDEPETGDVDLLDLVARQTFLNAGTVYVCAADEMVGAAPATATFRY
jgi:hypothetical protein